MKRRIKKIRKTLFIAALVILTVAVPFAIHFLTTANKAQAVWFNDNWPYRKQIQIISHTATENNVYVTVPTFDATDTTRFKSNCGNIRFTKEDGTLLPYYVVNCNATATIHVFFDTLPGGSGIGTNYYMYYGNVTAQNGFSTTDFTTQATGTVISNASEVTGPGPVLSYAFDEGQGTTANDSSYNAYTGTITNSTWQTEDQCIAGKCLNFNGTTDYVSRTANVTSNTTDFTVQAWLKPNSISQATLVVYNGNDNAGYGIGITDGGGGGGLGNHIIGLYGAVAWIDTGYTVTADQWYFVTLTRTGTTTKMYVNGVQQTLTFRNGTSTDNPLTPNARFSVGMEFDGTNTPSRHFNGNIDEAKVYTFARTADQVKADYNARGGNHGAAINVGGDQQYLSKGLVGYWKMDETTNWTNDCSATSVTDSSKNGNNGKSCPNGTGPLGNTAGKFGNGGNFDGSDDDVQITGSSVIYDLPQMTVSAWIKPNSLGGSSGGRIFDRAFTFQLSTSNQLTFSIAYSSADIKRTTGNNAFTLGVWNHVVATWDGTPLGSGIKIFVNGTEVSSYSTTQDPQGTRSSDNGTLHIGNRTGNDRQFDGRIDEARIYNRALSPAEVNQLYNWAPGPIAYYNFDENYPTTVAKNGGMLTYPDSQTTDSLKYRYIDASGNWSTATATPDIDTTSTNRVGTNMKIYSSAIRNEKMMISMHFINATGESSVYATVWDGNNNKWLNDGVNSPKQITANFVLSGGADSNPQYADGAYLSDGRFMVVSADNTSIPKAYFWDGTSWSAAVSTKDITNIANQIDVVARPGTSEAMIVSMDIQNDLNTIYYDGSGQATTDFTLHTTHTTTLAIKNRTASFVWSQNNPLRGEMSFTNATSDTTPVVNVFTANGSGGGTWGTANQSVTLANNNDNTQIVDRPGANSFLPCWEFVSSATNCLEEHDNDTTPTLNTTTQGTLVATGDSSNVARSFSIAYEQKSGATAIAVYGDVTAIPKLKKYDPSNTTWDAGATSLTNQGHSSNIRTVDLIPDPSSDDIIIITRDQAANRSLRTVFWDGVNNAVYSSGGRSSTEHTTTSGFASTNHSGFFAWDKYSANDTIHDQSGNGYNSALRGAGRNFFVTGKYGSALSLNGTNNYTYLYDTSAFDFSAASQFSIEAWVKTSVVGPKYIVSKGDATNGTYKLYEDASGNICFGTSSNGNSFPQDSACSSGTSYADGKWHHVVGQKDGISSLGIFVDGVSKGSDTAIAANGTLSNGGALYVGADIDGTSPWNGLIDEVKIYNYLRSGSQIIEDLNGGHPAGGSPVASQIIYWKFNEGYGTTANNYVPTQQSLTGTLSSGVAWERNGTCRFNNCVKLTATTDNISGGNVTAINSTASMSASLWLYPTTLSTSQMILSKAGTAGDNNRIFDIRTDNSTASEVRVDVASTTGTADGTNYCLTSGLGLTASTWQQLTMVYDGTQPTGNNNRVKVFKNGKQISCTVTGTIPNVFTAGTANLKIGRGDDTGFNSFVGLADEFRLYNFALTASQVAIDTNANAALNVGVGAAASEAANLADGAGAPPVEYWNFEENSGSTVNDVSGNGNAGTWHGTGTRHWISGRVGTAGNFNGTNDYVTLPTAATAKGDAQVTLEGWVKDNTVGIVSDKQIYWESVADDSATTRLGLIVVGSGGGYCSLNQFAFVFRTLGFAQAGASVCSTTLAQAGKWYHITAIFDSVSQLHKLYVNGRLEGTTSNSYGAIANTNPAGVPVIGAQSDGSQPWPGSIDDFKIYNYARTQAQVAYDYNRGRPIAWWKFDECQGGTANDNTGNGNSGTITITAAGGNTNGVGTCSTATSAWGSGATGKFNGSLFFDGNGDKVTVTAPSSLPIGNQPFTKSAWIKPTTHARYTIFQWGTGSANQNNMTGLGAAADGCTVTHVDCIIQSFFSDDVEYGSGSLAGAWHQIVVTFTGANLKMYLDGKQVKSTNMGPENVASTNITIGMDGGGSQAFNGQIDDVRLYNYALSATQVKQLYNGDAAVRYGPVSGSP